MDTKNTWLKGLNSDLSKLKEQPDSFLDGYNFRILTEEGSSSFAIENIKGPLLQFKLPKVQSTYKLDFTEVGSGDTDINFDTAFPYSSNTITITNADRKSLKQISEELNTFFEGITELQYMRAYYNTEYISLYNYVPESSTTVLSSITTYNGVTSTKLTRTIDTQTVLGWGTYEDNLVIISTSRAYLMDNPEEYSASGLLGTEGFIWLIPIDNVTNQPVDKDGNLVDVGEFLDPLSFLKYAQMLNLSREYCIYKEVKCRKENIEVARVLWTDFYNDLRTINILDPQVQATPLETTTYLPVHNPQQPYVNRIIEGGFLPTGNYQGFYQLSSLQGAVSTVSPLSNLITLGSQDPISNFTGAEKGTNSTKSIEFKVTNIDTSYDIIRFGYVVYQVPGVAECFFYDERVIPNSGTVISVLNGNENDIPIDDITQLSNVNRSPNVFKTIEVVRNRFLAANAKTTFFDVDFDSRVYRFNEAGNCPLYNQFDSYTTSPSGSAVFIVSNGISIQNVYIDGVINPDGLVAIPDDYDLINPYNNEDPSYVFNDGDWINNSQFKYQADNSTFGGTGLNLSYEFITQSTTEDNTDPNKYLTPPYIRPNYNFVNNYQPGNGQVFNTSGSYNTVQSPYISSLFTGYARGEVYRWGLVFLDKFGYPSPVKWIGDIKFPSSGEGFEIGFDNIGDGSGQIIGKQLGIKFTLDTNSTQFQDIKDKISGWYFVRMDRTVTDKTRLGNGIMAFPTVDSGRGSIPNFFKNDVSGFTYDTQKGCLYIPSFLRGLDNQYSSTDYIKVLGIADSYDGNPANLGLDKIIQYNATGITDTFLLSYRKYSWYNDSNSIYQSYRNLNVKYSVPRSTDANNIPSDSDLNFDFFPMGPTNITALANSEFTQYGNQLDLVVFDDNSNLVVKPNTYNYSKYIVSYERFNSSQYGGNDRASRYNNEYFPVYFQPYNKTITGEVTSEVYNGDVYVCLTEFQVLEKNIESDSGFQTEGGTQNRVAIMYLSEAHEFNPKFVIYDSNGTPTYRANDFNIYEDNNIINPAYAQENTTTRFYSKAFNQILVKDEPNAIYVTDNKIDGERVDSWRFFRLNNTLYVNGNFGPINKIINFKDKLYFYQTNALGIAAINERVLINEGSTEQTQLGTGGVLQRFDYVSTETGAFNQFAVEASGNSLYHYDANINKFFRLSSDGTQPLSDIKGLSGLFRTLPKEFRDRDKLTGANPAGVHVIFNPQYNEIYLTFVGNGFNLTLAFNELLDAFQCKYDFTPTMYMNMRKRLLSIKTTTDSNNVYTHDSGTRNNFYGIAKPTKIKFRVNPNPDVSKVFDNLAFNTEVYDSIGNIVNDETIKTVQCSNDYQNSGLNLIPDNIAITEKLRTWRLYVPRNLGTNTYGFKERLADKYMDVEVSYTQDIEDDKKFILHDVVTSYSVRNVILPKNT